MPALRPAALPESRDVDHIQGGRLELAQHNEEVLLEVGYTWEEIEALNRKGVTAFVEGGE